MTDSKPKQQWEVEQQIRNWVELPNDVMANVLYRIGVIDILENAQSVCTTWRQICKHPAMWKVIHMESFSDVFSTRPLPELIKMCKNAVDRSEGQLVDISIVHFVNDDLIQYVADRSSQLRRLHIVCGNPGELDGLKDALKKLPLLEELNLYKIKNSKGAIEAAGRYCPMLTTLKVNLEEFRFWPWKYSGPLNACDKTAIAIGENLHGLRHLELIGNSLSNSGLQAILDGCPHLELLDLRKCLYVDLNGDLGKKCSERIKCLKLPNDSIEGCVYYNDIIKITASDDIWRDARLD